MEMDKFSVALEKMLSFELEAIFWSNTMDLIAMISKSNTLEVHRISYKSQKIFQIEEKLPFSAAVFSPDANYVLYACNDGSITIVKTENGEKIFQLKNGFHNQNVVNVNWAFYTKLYNNESFNPIKKNSFLDKMISPISPQIHSDKFNVAKLKYYSEIPNDVTLAASSDNGGNVVIGLNGIHKVVKFNLKDFPEVSRLENFQIISTFFSSYEAYLNVLLNLQTSDIGHQNLYLIVVDTNVLSCYKDEIMNVIFLISYIDDMIIFLKNTFTSVLSQIKEIQKNFDNKMRILEDLILANNPGLSTNEELLKFFKSGICSQALIQFFTKELYDSKILQKLDEALTINFTNIQDYILESCQNVIQRIIGSLSKLESFSEIDEKFKILGVSKANVIAFGDTLKRLFFNTEQLLISLTETKLNIRNLLVWLNKNVIKTLAETSETEIENQKSFLNKYTVDVERLYNFLSDDSLFQLRNLQSFFSTNKEEKMIDESNAGGRELLGAEKNILKCSTNKIREKGSSLVKQLFQEDALKEIAGLFSDIDSTSSPFTPENKHGQVNHISQLMTEFEKKNIAQSMKDLDSLWISINTQPRNNIFKCMRVVNMTNLGNIFYNSELVVHTPQDLIQNDYSLIFSQKSSDNSEVLQICNVIQNEKKHLDLNISLVEIPPTYEIRNTAIGKDKEILLLMTKLGFFEDESVHTIITSLDETQNQPQIKVSNFNQIPQLNMADKLRVESRRNPMRFKKAVRLESQNITNLRASLKGLVSVIADDNKLIILE